MFLEDLHLQLRGAGRDFHPLRGLVASALFQTDLLPSWICVSGPSVQPRVLLPRLGPVKGWGGGYHYYHYYKNMLISTWSLSQLISFIDQFRCIFKVLTKKKNVTHKACVLFGINLMTSACDLRIRRIKLMLYYASPTPTYCNFHQRTWFNDIESSVALDFHQPVKGLSALELTTPGNESDGD